MALLVDSGIFVSLERWGRGLDALDSLGPSDEPLGMASISIAELLAGLHRADTPARRVSRERFIAGVLDRVAVLPFDLPEARVYAALWTDLRARGQMIEAHDLMIAATALAHGYSVLTENARDFDRVPGLVVHRPNW